MISKIYQSVYIKPMALLLATSFLCMSFRMRGNGEVVLNAGTAISLETVSMIRSDNISVGKSVDFRVMYDIKVGDKTVIFAGSIARGQVIRAHRAKGLGKEGFVEVQIKTVQAVDGQEVYLAGGNILQEGEDQEMLAILLGVLVCILFLTIKGKDAVIPKGYQVTANVATTMTINAQEK